MPVILPDANGCFAVPADGAKFMASLGIPQIPLRGKRPFFNEWPTKGSTDFAQIDRWAAEFVGCNFGSVAKRSLGGHFALEVDSVDVRATYQKENPGYDFTASLIIQSGAGRGHRWYLFAEDSLSLQNIGQEDAAGFSLRVDNEQCVSPGSIHPERGTQYSVVVGNAPTVASCQEIAWFRTKKSQAQEIKKAQVDENGKRVLIRHGAMYDALISQAGKLWNSGFSPDKIPDMLVDWAEQNCEQPIDENKVRSYARGSNWKQGEPGAAWVYFGSYESTEEPTVEEKLPEFPRLGGALTELAEAICPDIPYEFKIMALITHWGLIRSGLDTFEDETHLQPRFYTCFVKEPGYGKTAAINEIRKAAELFCVHYSCMSSVDSGPALVDEFSDVLTNASLSGIGTEVKPLARVLLDPDEMTDLLEKAKVTQQSKNSLGSELLKLYETNRTGNRSRKAGKSQVDVAHLAILGGATPEGYERMWIGTGSGSTGLQSRFVTITTVAPKMPIDKTPTNSKAFDRLIPLIHKLANRGPQNIRMDERARTMFRTWWTSSTREKACEIRIEDMVKRLLIVLGGTNEDDTLIDEDIMDQAIRWAEYIIACREKFNVADSYTYTQAFEGAIRRVGIKAKRSMSQNQYRRLTHADSRPGGYGPFIQAWRNMIAVGELIEDGANRQSSKLFRHQL